MFDKEIKYLSILLRLKKRSKTVLLCLPFLVSMLLFQPNVVADTFQQPTQIAQAKTKQEQKKAERKKQRQLERKNERKEATKQPKAKEFTREEIQKAKEGAVEAGSPIREEIQRYMGYEKPLTERYLSIPYDISMNTNVNGGFVDISYLLLMFLPVILLLGFIRKPLYGFIIILTSIVVLSISTTTSFGIKRNIIHSTNVDDNIDNFLNAISFSDLPVSVICAHVYRQLCYVYEPLHLATAPYSGEQDSLTYPLLTLLFILFFFVLQKRIEHHDKRTIAMVNFLYLFSYIWLILASGIIWYGYLMLAVGFAIMTAALTKTGEAPSLLKKGVFALFMIAASLWVAMGYVYRISNHHMVTEDSARMLFDIPSVKYQTGVFDEGDVINNLLPGVEKAIREINADENAKVYRIGTFIPYFIRKNDQRVLQDNQLGFFHNLTQKFKDRITITQALKASGYRYILVDLNTASIDKTPEKSLTLKFNSFLGYIFGNKDLELLATNRVITLTPPGSTTSIYTHGVFGKVHKPGTFAVYKIK